jgi:hypothetical protein
MLWAAVTRFVAPYVSDEGRCLAIFRVAVIILNKQSLTADKGRSFSSFAARASSNLFTKINYNVMEFYMGLETGCVLRVDSDSILGRWISLPDERILAC